MHHITQKIAAGIGTAAAFRTYRDQAYPQRHFPAGTRLCAEGFRGGSSVGLPCVTLH